jgi:hypothetical protein
MLKGRGGSEKNIMRSGRRTVAREEKRINDGRERNETKIMEREKGGGGYRGRGNRKERESK